MTNLTEKQRTRLQKALNVEMNGSAMLLRYLFELEEKLETNLNDVRDAISNIKLQKGDDGYTPVKGKDYFDGEPGKPGKNYTITDKDYSAIAKKVKVPVAKKIIEKITTVKETPIITEIHKEVLPDQVVEKINLSEGKIDRDRIEGFDDYTDKKTFKEEIDILKNRIQVVLQIATQGQRTSASSSSSGSFAVMTPTGTVNGSNTSFTFPSAPLVIVVDGVPKQKTQSDGTANWTGTTSVTLSVAPNFDIFGY